MQCTAQILAKPSFPPPAFHRRCVVRELFMLAPAAGPTHLAALAQAQRHVLHAWLQLRAVPQHTAPGWAVRIRGLSRQRQGWQGPCCDSCGQPARWHGVAPMQHAIMRSPGALQQAPAHSGWKVLLRSMTEPLKARPKGPPAATSPCCTAALLLAPAPLSLLASRASPASAAPGGQVPCGVPKMCSATAPCWGATRALYTPSSSSPAPGQAQRQV